MLYCTTMGRLRFSWRYTVILILHWIAVVIKVTSAGGIFELRLNSFTNDQGLDFNGHCCGNTTSDGNTNQCVGSCKTFFSVCLLHFLFEIPEEPTSSQCTFSHLETPILGENTFPISDGLYNPIQIPFNIDWPGDFSLALDAWHNGSITDFSDGAQHTPGGHRRLLARLRTQQYLNVSTEWSNFTYPTDTHSLSISYRVICQPDSYGSKCNVPCEPRDDQYGHYRCNNEGQKECLEGWDGNWCERAICSEDCEHGTCVAPEECRCQPGYTGARCDQCELYPGCVHGTCQQPGDCNCDEGWGGLLCDTDLNYCTHNQPCRHGGTCHNEGAAGYTCYCPPNYTGVDCETAEACPCMNGGTCRSGADGYTCLCPAGYSGDLCEVRIPRCDSERCLNGGTCLDVSDGYRCACPAGYSGIHCEIRDHCAEIVTPCENGGTCINNNVGYQCRCVDGFRGDRCEENLCATHGCQNGGTCRAESDSIHCDCPQGYNGRHCQTNIDDCVHAPCKNGATCHDLVNDYRCECPFGFGGRNCSDRFTPCDGDNPCANGGTCLQDVMGGFRCECADGWKGTTCTVSTALVPTSKPSSGALNRSTETQPPVRGTSSPSRNFGLSDTTQLVIYVAFGLLIIALVIILIVVVYRKQHHQEPRPKDLESNTTSTPNNRNKLTYRDNFSQEEKVLPLLSISEKVCNKEQDTYSKTNTTTSTKVLQHKNHHKDYSIKEFEGPPSMNKLVIPTSGSMHYVPQARHSYPRNNDSEDFYYYDEKTVQLKRTDSLQTPSQSSSSQSTPRHTVKCPILQISAVVEDRGSSTPVRLLATEV
uniref:Delta-like protein n=1 Tax=Eucidaris tribuloides TaxID=7632 RepID=E0A8P5_EUCTR|nr:delta [Eucidaris tribuloides]